MDRKELARSCARIDAAGGSVREFLKGLGFISPWGTWFRLQKEELGRKDCHITDGRGSEEMKKVTLEQKKKAVDIALSGGNPLDYLKEIGSKQPAALWYAIKKVLKEADPEKYGKLPARANAAEPECWKPKAEPVTTCCARSTREGVEVPDELPEENLEMPAANENLPDGALGISAEILERMVTKPLNYDGFEVTGLKTEYGRFQVSNNGYLFFGANADDELEMPIEIWRKFAEDLPKVMAILGVV